MLSSFLKSFEGQSFLELAGETEEGGRFVYYRKSKDVEPYYWSLNPPDGTNFAVEEASSLGGKKVYKMIFPTLDALREARKLVVKGSAFESDLDFNHQFFMAYDFGPCLEIAGEPKESRKGVLVYYNNPIRKASFTPAFKTFSFDLETNVKSSDFTSPDNDLYSISIHSQDCQCVLMLDTKSEHPPRETLEGFELLCFKSERDILEAFIHIVQNDPANIFIGWNVVNFDFQFLYRKALKYEIPLKLGHDEKIPEGYHSKNGDFSIKIPGKAVIDGMQLVKAQAIDLENYKLDTAASVLLGKSKTIQSHNEEKVKEIENLFQNNKRELARYNYIDSKLVDDIFKKVSGTDFFAHYHLLSETSFGRAASFIDFSEEIYLKKLHARNVVAPDKNFSPPYQVKVNYQVYQQEGFHGRTLKIKAPLLDAKIIAFFFLDVFANWMGNAEVEKSIVYGKGLHFHPQSALSSQFLKNLLAKVDESQKENVFQKALFSLIRHFTSGLLNRYNRVYSPLVYHLATQIKKEILIEAGRIVETSFSVLPLYNSDDALYLRIEGLKLNFDEAFFSTLNEKIKTHFQEKYGVDADLGWQKDGVFERIFISEGRYALFKDGEVINHLDAHRYNVPYLKFFQDQILKAAFLGANLPDLIEAMKKEMKEGKHDSLLVYKRKINPNKKEESELLPHVIAAKKGNQNLTTVEYVITKTGGADPVGRIENPIDYEYYIKKYVDPSARLILKRTAFSSVETTKNDGQIDLFSL